MEPALQPHGIPPTPETARKRRYVVIGNLVAGGRITTAQAEAADEIRMVLVAVGRGMFPSSGWTPRIGKKPKGKTWRDLISRMEPGDLHDWERHYMPWTREMSQQISARIRGTRLRLVLDIVIDNASLREVEARYGLAHEHGVGCAFLRAGLERYVHILKADPLDRPE